MMFLSQPEIDFEFEGAARLATKLPAIKERIRAELVEELGGEAVFPRRLTLPLSWSAGDDNDDDDDDDDDNDDSRCPSPGQQTRRWSGTPRSRGCWWSGSCRSRGCPRKVRGPMP